MALAAGATRTAADPPRHRQHAILLIQLTPAHDSRTWIDFETPARAVQGAIDLYEDRLRSFNPLQRDIKYTVEDLFRFLDGLADLSCLLFDPALQAYAPKPREWIKQQALVYLQKQAKAIRR